MPLPSCSESSPWPVQTQAPQPRRRKILPPPERRALSARQEIFNQTGVEEARRECAKAPNEVISCFPTSDTIFPQHDWASFVWNSQLPDFTRTQKVNIFLFHADSGEEVLRVINETNPFGRAGSITKQVNDSWFPNDGVDFNGSSTSYPYYLVVIGSDLKLDGTETPQATFTAVQTTIADSVASSIASSSSAASASAASAASTVLTSPTPGSLQLNSQSDFPHWAIAVIVVLGFFAILALGILGFLLVRRARHNQSSRPSRHGSIGSASPMMTGAGHAPQSPLMEQTPAPRPASLYSPNDGSSMTSHAHSNETPFSGADAAIMADAFRKALRKPDFAGGTIEEGDSPDSQEPKEQQILSRELAEEGRDIRSVGSSRDVRVETLSDAEDKAKDAPR